MNDTKIEPWTEADTDRAEQDVDAYGAIMSPEGYRIIAEVKRQAAEIERLAASEASCVRAALDEVGNLKAELDTARAELHACGLELQTCRSTLEEERRDGDVQRAEIERLTAELAGQSKATLDWREAAKRHMARAEAAEKLALRMADAADLERELANLRHTVNEGIEITHDRAVKIDAQKAEIERLTVALRHAVDIARDIGAQRDRAFDVANRATDMRPGLTEEQALATAGPLSRDIYNRIGLATGNRIGAPEWMRDSIAAALLRASRGAPAPTWRSVYRFLRQIGEAPGHVSIPRRTLEKLVDATRRNHDVREARDVARHVLHLDALRYEPARTDPLFARVIAEATQHDARLVPPAPDLSDLAAGKARGLVRSGASSADLLDRLTSEAIPRLAVEATAADPDRSRLRAAVSDAAGIVLAIATLRGAK